MVRMKRENRQLRMKRDILTMHGRPGDWPPPRAETIGQSRAGLGLQRPSIQPEEPAATRRAHPRQDPSRSGQHRRAPQTDPDGKPGYLRVNTVHLGDREGEKGSHVINIADEVTWFELRGPQHHPSTSSSLSPRSSSPLSPASLSLRHQSFPRKLGGVGHHGRDRTGDPVNNGWLLQRHGYMTPTRRARSSAEGGLMFRASTCPDNQDPYNKLKNEVNQL